MSFSFTFYYYQSFWFTAARIEIAFYYNILTASNTYVYKVVQCIVTVGNQFILLWRTHLAFKQR